MADNFDRKEMWKNVLVIIGVCFAYALLPLLLILAVGYGFYLTVL